MLEQLLDFQTLLVFLLVFFVVYAYKNALRPDNLPNGPPTVPFLGNLNLAWYNKKLHLRIDELRKEYGDIFSFQLGFYPAVVISNPELIKDALVKQADTFSNRGTHFVILKMLGSKFGIINNHGPVWKASRKMAISSLRELGLGKSSLENKIQEEAEILVTEIGKNEGNVECDILFAKASSNIICSMLFDKRYDHNDPEFVTLISDLDSYFQMASQMNPILFLPYLIAPLLLLDSNSYKQIGFAKRLGKFMEKQIEEHKQTYNPGVVRDFVDIYLESEKENMGNEAYAVKNIVLTMFDLFLAGSETTSTTLRWAISFMCKNQDVQEKCREEINKVIESERLPSASDRDNMPYVDATICEIQRLANIAPHSVFHCTNGPVEFHGYKLPDKTIIIPNLYSINFDPELWEDPQTFNPGRFLNSSGKVEKPPHFIPFSIGRRICAGENLAKIELFIFFTSLLQKYKFTCEDVSKLPTMEDANMGITLSPPTFTFRAERI